MVSKRMLLTVKAIKEGFFILLLLIVIGLVLFLYFQRNQTNINSQRKIHDAIDILDERYTRGEIDEEEYTQRKKILRGD